MPDVWRQMHDLQETFTRKWEVRSDLEVTALAPQRSVRLRVGDFSFNKMKADPRDYTPEPKITDRNVGTMRELAEALIAACDFVDASNPEWAGRRSPTKSKRYDYLRGRPDGSFTNAEINLLVDHIEELAGMVLKSSLRADAARLLLAKLSDAVRSDYTPNLSRGKRTKLVLDEVDEALSADDDDERDSPGSRPPGAPWSTPAPQPE